MGSNLGDRAGQIDRALTRIGSFPGTTVLAVSSLLENEPIGMDGEAGMFLNLAVKIATTLSSHALLHELQTVEKELGRTRSGKPQPRTIDLDILLYGDRIISSDELIIPHPLMQERRFVLQPLAEIAPDAVHPVLQMTIAGLLENLTGGVAPNPR
jgi:2-amino-4-hydroxy-6-hydroxymethyldihydropteridine diphosphokinase